MCELWTPSHSAYTQPWIHTMPGEISQTPAPISVEHGLSIVTTRVMQHDQLAIYSPRSLVANPDWSSPQPDMVFLLFVRAPVWTVYSTLRAQNSPLHSL